MASAGPEAGWYFDPDGGDIDRYWNGVAWTEHRRSRQPTANQPRGSFSHPVQDVDSISGSMPDGRHQAGSVSEEHVRSQDADAPTTDRSDTDLHDEVPSTPSDEAASGGVTPIVDEWSAGEPSSSESSPTTHSDADTPAGQTVPTAESAELRVGGWAEVVAGGRMFKGGVGKIVSLSGSDVRMRLKGSLVTLSFRRKNLRAITPPPSHQSSSPPAGSERISSNAGKQWLQSIKDTGRGRVERGSSRWVVGLAIIAAGGVLVVSTLLPWAHDTRSGSVISVSGLGAISVNGDEGVASIIKEFNNYGIPGIWAFVVGLIVIVAGAAFLWTRWRSQTALTVAILGGIEFLACMADAMNVEAVMGNPAASPGEYAIGFGLLFACAVTLVLVGLGITAFVLERISISTRSPG